MDKLFLLRPCHGSVISWRPHTAEVCVECQARVCEVCGEQSGTRTGFSPSTSSFLCPYYSFRAPYSFLSYCYSYKKSGRSLGTFKQSNAVSHIGGHWTEKYFVIRRRYSDRPTRSKFLVVFHMRSMLLMRTSQYYLNSATMPQSRY
jgi:hypothetical protein